MVANEAMANNQIVYADPSQGGLVGNLYIEPRNLMLEPDTTIVGCSQNGSGALGLDAYLSQPSWVTQSLIYTQLYVPEENFRVGFPAGGSGGSVISVDSYFATDTFGDFHLADGDVEGDYQFALIADDSARLYLGSPGSTTLYVDDQKPASYNNGTCLPQTQAAHMSCTNDWSSQTAANVVTVHLAPGQILSMELQYWQGPGEGIALMAFYRPVPSDASQLIDSTNCGQTEDFASGSTNLTALQQNWKPITMGNLTALITQ